MYRLGNVGGEEVSESQFPRFSCRFIGFQHLLVDVTNSINSCDIIFQKINRNQRRYLFLFNRHEFDSLVFRCPEITL